MSRDCDVSQYNKILNISWLNNAQKCTPSPAVTQHYYSKMYFIKLYYLYNLASLFCKCDSSLTINATDGLKYMLTFLLNKTISKFDPKS